MAATPGGATPTWRGCARGGGGSRCTREEQMRWLHEAWTAALEVRAEGVDVRAVAVWSLLGCYDWSSLLTCEESRYEPGAFDLRAPAPRPTALAGMMRELAAGC